MNDELLPKVDDNQDMMSGKFPWYLRWLVKLSPRLFFRYFSRENKVNFKDIDYSYKLFENKKIHIEPLYGPSRGFILKLDNKLTLWFFQDGDHFKYDGFEMGEYDDGDVTVLDKLKVE